MQIVLPLGSSINAVIEQQERLREGGGQTGNSFIQWDPLTFKLPLFILHF